MIEGTRGGITLIDSGIESVVAGANITVDNTDPSNPIISATGGGSFSVAVSGKNGIGVAGSPITSAGTIDLSLGDITPSSISTGTGVFSGKVSANGVNTTTVSAASIGVTGDINSGGRITTSAATISALLTGNTASFSGIVSVSQLNVTNQVTTSAATITAKLTGATAVFSGKVSADGGLNTTTVSAASIGTTGDIVSNGRVTTSAATITALLTGNTANFSGIVSALDLNVANTVKASAANITSLLTGNTASFGGIVSASDLNVTNTVKTSAATITSKLTGATAAFSGKVSADGGINTTTISAASIFSDALLVVTSAATNALEVRQTGSGNCFYVEDAANPDATPYVIDATGRVIQGNSTLIAVGGANPQYALHGSTAGTSTGAFCNWQAAATGPTLAFSKSRNATPGSFTVVTSGDSLGTLGFYGDNSVDVNSPGATISVIVDGSAATNSMPGRIKFATVSAGATALSTRMEISNTGSLRLNIYGTGTLTSDANGNITSSSDERYKDITGDFNRGLDAILGLEPKLFHWNEQSKLSQTELNAGFIAQNVKEFIPEAVFEKDGYYTMIDRPIIAALVNAVKELARKS